MVQLVYVGTFNGFGTTNLSPKRAGSSTYKNADICNESIKNWFDKKRTTAAQKGRPDADAAAQLTPHGISLRLAGAAVDAQRASRIIKYENIRMVTKLPPAHPNGRSVLAITSNDCGGLSGARPMSVSNLSQGKAFKIISHMFTPATDQALDEFYGHVISSLTRRTRRPTMSAPTQRIAMSMLTQASWMNAYTKDAYTKDKENGHGGAPSLRRKSRSSLRRKSRARSTRSARDVFGDEVETVNGEEVWSF